MAREIKRYESRKLYDTEESRYVSLEEIAQWVRAGQDVRVVDNATGDDVTAQTLAQIILEEGRSGRSKLPSELFHDLIRRGEKTLNVGVEQVQQGVHRFLNASVDRLTPVREARQEMSVLRARLDELESSLEALEDGSKNAGFAEATGASVTSPASPAIGQAEEKRTAAARGTKKTGKKSKTTKTAGRTRKAPGGS